ncbi:diguanylate cyclase, partial [Actinotalea sp. C106]|uniref:histidine kinase N-terminal 7TM domain-containing diguanylate cyclase n=1 Tax=Actinotalea sp. C106 TaxID=2908644 RepID=UPI00202916B6
MHTVLAVLNLLGAGLAGLTAGLVWRRRAGSPLARPLVLALVGCVVWAVVRSASTLATHPDVTLALDYAVYPAVALVTASGFWYLMVLAGWRSVLDHRVATLLAVEPVVLVVVVLTDRSHGLLYRSVGQRVDGRLVTELGPLFVAHAVYSYLLLVLAGALVVRAMSRAVAGHRRVYAVALVGGLVPFAGSVVSLLWRPDGVTVDLAPSLFLVTAGIWFWVERYGEPAGLVPLSTRQVLAALTDAVMVLDPEGRVLDVNPAGVRLLTRASPRRRESLIGARWSELVPADVRVVFEGAVVGGVPLDGQPARTVRAPDGRSYEVRVNRITASRQVVGAVAVVRDVTELERLRAELAEQAVRDGLTGLYNRRHLELVLLEAVVRAGSAGTPLSAVMVDIDHFKQVNDRHGHAVGDALLVKVADELAGGVREADAVARYGGEEFVLLLPGSDATTAAERAETWRERCAALRIAAADGEIGVTISAGVA